MPSAVRKLFSEHLPSVERLEVLLLLFESPDRTWTIDDIERHIRSSRDSIQQNVRALVASELIAAVTGAGLRYRFASGPATTNDAVTELARMYRTRRVAVVEQIYSERREADRNAPARKSS